MRSPEGQIAPGSESCKFCTAEFLGVVRPAILARESCIFCTPVLQILQRIKVFLKRVSKILSLYLLPLRSEGGRCAAFPSPLFPRNQRQVTRQV